MIHILLLILKIAGILLLVLLGLVLAALLCLLFVPVRYRIQGSRHGQLQAHGQLSWLLHIITLHGWYQSQELEVKLKLFGFTLWPRQKKEKKRKRTAESVEESGQEDGREILLSEELAPPKAEDSSDQESFNQEARAQNKERIPSKAEETQSGPRIEFRRIFRRFSEKLQKIKFSILGICDKLRNIKETAGNLIRWIQDEGNQKNIRFLADCLKRVLKHIFPRKGTMRLVFGFDDPSSTGQVLAWVGPFYPLYGQIVTLQPVFDRSILEGEGDVWGRIRLFTILRIGFQIRRNRDVWNMLKKLRQ